MQPATIGHNQPPSEIDLLKMRLETESKDIVDAYEQITQNPIPQEIHDEIMAGKTAETIKTVIALQKDAEAIHKKIKQPYLDGGRAVDTWKNDIVAKLDLLKSALSKPLQAHLKRREEEERQRLLEEARKKQEEADRLAAEARAEAEALAAEASAHDMDGISDTANELMDAAIEAEAVADAITNRAITATPAQLVKARAFGGAATASAKSVWVGEITMIDIIDLEALRPYFTESAIQAALNAFVRVGGRKLRGAVIKEQTKLNIR